MATVPDTGLPVGTNLVYNATISTSLLAALKSGIWSPESLFSAIAPDLRSSWGLQITHSDYSSVEAAISGDVPITLQLQMVGPNTYAQPDDVRSIVDGEIITATGGNYITSSNISSFTLPAGAAQQTGAPANTPGLFTGVLQELGLSGAAESAANASGSALGFSLSSKVLLTIVAMFGILGFLIYASPTAPARAVAAFRGGRRK